MKICEILKQNHQTLSLELFPPKEGTELSEGIKIATETAMLAPDFISVTYGAAGGAYTRTLDIASEIHAHNVPALTHLTCVNSDKAGVRAFLDDMKRRGLDNILALRGDIIEGRPQKTDFRYASDLVSEIKAYGDFCVGGACYPEVHPESFSRQTDLEALKIKVECGCAFLTTQMFFENRVMFSFVNDLVKAGITVPIVAGIMPVTNAKQIRRIYSLSQAKLPQSLIDLVEKYADSPDDMLKAGIEFSAQQIRELKSNGIGHIHIYIMNRPNLAAEIMKLI